MKKILFYLMLIVLSLSSFPPQLMATEKESTAIASNTEVVSTKVESMPSPLEEIKITDKSFDKKEVRKEANTTESALGSAGNGVYLTIGTIVIVVLLLILLL